MQKNRAATNAGGVYVSDGIRVANSVDAAPLTKIKGKYVARSTLNLRAAASTRGQAVGSVRAGQTFQALGRTGDGKWVLGRPGRRGRWLRLERLRLPGLKAPSPGGEGRARAEGVGG